MSGARADTDRAARLGRDLAEDIRSWWSVGVDPLDDVLLVLPPLLLLVWRRRPRERAA